MSKPMAKKRRAKAPSAKPRRPSSSKPHNKRTTIAEFTEQYIMGRDICANYANNLRKRAEKLAAFVGSSALPDVFNEATLNEFLASLDLHPLTVRSYRSDLLALWNNAGDLDLAPYPRHRRIRRPKCPRLVIECFSVAEVRAILAQVPLMHQSELSNGVDRAVYWNAIIRLAWDSGLRRSDCWSFKKSWIKRDGTARVVQKKTGQVVVVKLHASTIEALGQIPYDKACHWPGAMHNSSRFCMQFKSLVRAAGVPKGTFKFLRRASGSFVELQQAGAGGKHLGHSDPRMFARHYDAQLGGHVGPMPPDLGRPDDAPAIDEFAFL